MAQQVRVAPQLGRRDQRAPERLQVEGACRLHISFEPHPVDPYAAHAARGDVFEPDGEEPVAPVGQVVLGAFLGDRRRSESGDGGQPFEPLGRHLRSGDAPAQREGDALRADARGVEDPARKLPHRDARGDAIEVELPLDAPILRGEPHPCGVDTPGPGGPGPPVLEVDRGRLRVDEAS